MNRSMSLDNMSFTQALSKAVDAVIRPPRAQYDENQISFIVYEMHSPPIPRIPISFPNRRGERLVGSLYQSIKFDTEKMHRCIIYLHGNIGSQKEGRFIVPYYAPHGISVFCFDFSGSGNSGGKYVTLGKNEKTDVIDVIRFLRDEMDFQEFILWGRSMGAACALMSTAILTHEVDQYYHKLRQNKMNPNSLLLANSKMNSVDVLNVRKHSESFSMKRDTYFDQFSAEKLDSVPSTTMPENENPNPPKPPLFQSTPILAKKPNILLADSSAQSSAQSSTNDSLLLNSNNTIHENTAELNENTENETEKREEQLTLDPAQQDKKPPSIIQKSNLASERNENKINSTTLHVNIDPKSIPTLSDYNSDLKPKIRKAKSQTGISVKRKSNDFPRPTSLSSRLYTPKSRASLPALIRPILPPLLPSIPQNQNRNPNLNISIQSQSPPLPKKQSKPPMPPNPSHNPLIKKPPQPPKIPKPPQSHQQQRLESDDNFIAKNQNQLFSSSSFSDDDPSNNGKKKPSLRIPVKGIIVDSAYSSLEDMLNAISTTVNLGSISSFVAQWYIKRSVFDAVGLTCKDVQPVESAKLCWRVPMLLGHSTQDDFVPFDQAKKIYNAYAGPKELVILSGGHNSERNEQWMNVCSRFIATYFGIELNLGKEDMSNTQKPEHAASFLNLIQNKKK